MYDERPYGEILRKERERNGYDLNSMSRHLHIRPDILKAIEESDFDRMPAKGYSKNMVRAYARALHLDERQITDMYLDQAYMHDVGEVRRPRSRESVRSARPTTRNYSSNTSNNDFSARRNGQSSRYSNSNSYSYGASNSRSTRRSNVSSNLNRSRSYGNNRRQSNQDRRRTASNNNPARNLGIGAQTFLQSITGSNRRQETKVGRSFDTIGSNPPYAKNNIGKSNAFAGLNIPLILLILAVLIVLIIVIVIVTNGSKQAVQEVPDIPISGLTDTSNTSSDAESGDSGDGSVDASAVAVPESVKVVLEVKDGNESWTEVYENGSSSPSIAEVLSGSYSKTFDVSDSITIRSANPDALSVTVDGDAVELESEGDGNYSYTLEFSDYLKQWKKDNNIEDSSSKSSESSKSSKSSES